ncbi:MAG: hypothetical protein ACAI43_18590 [Phycisphaerae bacterium]
MHALTRLITEWESDGITLCPPLSASAVRALFEPIADRVSEDVLRLYTLTGGMHDRGSDRHLFSLWPPTKVAWVATIEPGTDMAFADVMIDAARFSFRRESPDRSAVYGGYNDDRRMADSVVDFFERVLTDPASVELFVT